MDAHYYERIIRRRHDLRERYGIPPGPPVPDLDAANGSGAMRAGHGPVSAPPGGEPDLDRAIEEMRAATAELINGRTDAWKARCSHLPNATLFGGWGGHERGWEQLEPRYEWASARFAGGEVEFEELARHVSGDLACTIHFERMRVRLAGLEQPVAVSLRVTHVYGREAAGWKLLHRHADHLTTVQPTESVVDR
jgi:ketosteroid isomerase-like protein